VQTLGGNYRICATEGLRQGRPRVLWPGLWRDSSSKRFGEYLQRYVELAPVVKAYVESIQVFLAPLDTDRRTRQRIEGAIAYALWGASDGAGALLPRDVRYRRRRENETPLSVTITSDEKIIGLPQVLVA